MNTQGPRQLLGGWPTILAAGLLATGAGTATAGLAIAHVGPFALAARSVSAESGKVVEAPLGDLASPAITPSPEVEVVTVPEPVEAPASAAPTAPAATASESPEPEEARVSPPVSPSASPTGEHESEGADDHPSPSTSASPEPSGSPDN